MVEGVTDEKERIDIRFSNRIDLKKSSNLQFLHLERRSKDVEI